MRTTGLLAAIGVVLLLATPSAQAQGNPVFNGPPSDAAPPASPPSSPPSSSPSNPPIDPPFNSPMNAPLSSPSSPSAPPPQATTPAADHWNSAAAAIWHAKNGQVKVAIGYSGVQPDADAAKASAIQACRDAGGSGCKAIGAWNSGCLYITTGHSSNRAGWGSGADVDTALKKCRAEGFACKQPIGGCVD